MSQNAARPVLSKTLIIIRGGAIASVIMIREKAVRIILGNSRKDMRNFDLLQARH
jgi:hypothetical protein